MLNPSLIKNMIRQTLRGLISTVVIYALTNTNAHALTPSALASPKKNSESTQGYNQPPKEILDVMRAPALPTPILNPTHDKILLVSMDDYPSISQVAAPFLRLAGVRIEPTNHSRHDTPGGYGIASCARSFSLVNVTDGKEKSISIAKLRCADAPIWNATGTLFAFRNRALHSVELWVGEARTATIHQVKDVALNPMFGSEMTWMPDQKSLLVKLVPKNVSALPPREAVPAAPSVQETSGEKGQSSTYEKRDTLTNAYDELVFDQYGVSQLARVTIATGRISPFGPTALYDSVQPAPDGEHLLVSQIVKPYSYLVTYDRFPQKIEVWNLQKSGAKIEKPVVVAELPLADRVPIHGVPMGPRDFSWKPIEPATLVWAEALDNGDWNVKAPDRDKVMIGEAPAFTPVELLRVEQRYAGIAWFAQKNLALLSQYDENTHWEKTWIINPQEPQLARRLLWDHSSDEKYADPGEPVFRRLANGVRVVQQFPAEADSIFLTGQGASDSGDRPFLDRLNLKTLTTERLFRSGSDVFERMIGFTGTTEKNFLTWRQSPTDVPNVFVRQAGEPARG